jgi:hypothetical protein
LFPCLVGVLLVVADALTSPLPGLLPPIKSRLTNLREKLESGSGMGGGGLSDLYHKA